MREVDKCHLYEWAMLRTHRAGSRVSEGPMPQPGDSSPRGSCLCPVISRISPSQAHHQQEAAFAQLEQLHQEMKRQDEVLAREVQEKEALVRERAGLEVRLQAVERDRQDLSEQLLGLR